MGIIALKPRIRRIVMDKEIDSEIKDNSSAKILYMTGRPELDDKLNWNTLRYVQRIAEHGSFLEAAEHLERSQANLSIKVGALEKTLGFAVFNRSDRGVTLTRKGEQLLRLVTPFLHDLHGFARAGLHENGVRTIRVVSTNAVMSYILLEPLMQYQEQHPEVRFDLVGDDIHLDLIRHDADIVIRPAMDIAPGITQIPLFTLVKKLYASQSYIDRYGEPKTVEELKNHKLIAPTNAKLGPHSDILWILRLAGERGQPARASYTSNTLECLIAYAKRGYGIASLYPLMSTIRDSDLVNILNEEEAAPLYYYANVASSALSDDSCNNLLNFLSNFFKSDEKPSPIAPSPRGVQSDV